MRTSRRLQSALRAIVRPVSVGINVHLFLVFSLILGILALDLWLPLGVAVWLLYLLPVWLASRHAGSRTWLVPITAFFCTVSVFLSFVHSPSELASSVPVINRSLATAALWVVAILLLRSGSAQSALSQQADRLEQQAKLLDSANVLIRELDGRIMAWSQGLERLYGYEKEEAVGEISHRLLRTVFPEPLPQIQAQLLAKDQWYGELIHTRRNGGQIVVASHWIVHRDDHGRPTAVLEVDNDITNLKEAEEARQESEDRFRILADTVPDIIFTNRPDGYSDFNNQRFYDYTGLPPQAGAGQGWTIAVHPDDLERTQARWRDSVRNGMPYEMELRLRAKDGNYRWFVGRARPVRDDKGRIMKWFGTCTDIHDLKLADDEVRRLLREAESRERELREKQAQLVQAAKLASLGELASGIAHELNNPLNNIGLFLGNALDRLHAGDLHPDDLIPNVQRALQQTERAATIIRHLRTFARTASAEHEPVSINEVVLSALSLVQEQLRLREIDVELELLRTEAMVLGSRIQLEQVLLNLISNARDALDSTSPKQIRISSKLETDRVEVRVFDTGAGIPAAVQPHIFDPFFTTKPVGEGTGLGLSISYGIIEDHGGRVCVESTRGGGTTFLIQLPLMRVGAPEAAAAVRG